MVAAAEAFDYIVKKEEELDTEQELVDIAVAVAVAADYYY